MSAIERCKRSALQIEFERDSRRFLGRIGTSVPQVHGLMRTLILKAPKLVHLAPLTPKVDTPKPSQNLRLFL